MTAPISNEPTTTRLHHYAGRYYPRSRGENQVRYPRAVWAEGSSPLTRGKRARNRVRELVPRLIPAHAGKTYLAGISISVVTAHPRSRGENDEAGKPVAADDGSSPLTRGKRRNGCVH